MKVQDYKGVSSKDKGTRNSVEKVKVVATEPGLRSGNSSTGETCQEMNQEFKMEAVGEAWHSGKLSNAVSDKVKGEGTQRPDSYEDDSTVVGNSKQDDPGKETDVKTRSHRHQPLHVPALKHTMCTKDTSMENMISTSSGGIPLMAV